VPWSREPTSLFLRE